MTSKSSKKETLPLRRLGKVRHGASGLLVLFLSVLLATLPPDVMGYVVAIADALANRP